MPAWRGATPLASATGRACAIPVPPRRPRGPVRCHHQHWHTPARQTPLGDVRGAWQRGWDVTASVTHSPCWEASRW